MNISGAAIGTVKERPTKGEDWTALIICGGDGGRVKYLGLLFSRPMPLFCIKICEFGNHVERTR